MFPLGKKEGLVRTSLALVLAVGVVAVASGCSSISTPAACAPIVKSGSASALVEATGAIAQAPTVKFPSPLYTDGLEATTLVKGKGIVLTKNAPAQIQASIYNGKTGKLLGATSMDAAGAISLVSGSASPLAKALECQTVGSRIASVVTAKEMYGDQIPATEPALAPSDALVIVTDIQQGFLAKANGGLAQLQPGFPSVVTAPDGTPGVTFLAEDAPTTLKVETVRQGSGDAIRKSDAVLVHYTQLPWPEKGTTASSVLTTTWTDKAPVAWTMEPFTPAAASADGTAAGTATGVISGLETALVGKKIGSQLIVVIPPGDDSYPESSLPTGVTNTTTLVYVVDVLGINR